MIQTSLKLHFLSSQDIRRTEFFEIRRMAVSHTPILLQFWVSFLVEVIKKCFYMYDPDYGYKCSCKIWCCWQKAAFTSREIWLFNQPYCQSLSARCPQYRVMWMSDIWGLQYGLTAQGMTWACFLRGCQWQSRISCWPLLFVLCHHNHGRTRLITPQSLHHDMWIKGQQCL